ncbi:MAG: DnaD domain protein [Clostridia bacterium]|nr:DnaD domain protein [Clostridia bacterium]
MLKLKTDFLNGAVAVPTDLIDKYLKLAPSASFKVLLFILRNPNGASDEKQISICTGLTESDVKDCIDYWKENDVIFDDGEKNEEEAKQAAGNAKATTVFSYEEQKEEKPKVVVKNLPVKKPTQRELALRIAEDENLTLLYREAQKIVGTFGYDTQSLLLMIYDYFGFSVDLIITLLSYQKSEGNLSSLAIKKRAEDWAKNGIDTLEAAVSEISALEQVQKTYIEIKAFTEFENEKPTPKVAKLLRSWTVNWGFSTEMILFALKESGKSFSEANKLLKKWYSLNIFDVESVNLKKKRTITSRVEKSYDVNNIGKSSVLERLKTKEKEGANV